MGYGEGNLGGDCKERGAGGIRVERDTRVVGGNCKKFKKK